MHNVSNSLVSLDLFCWFDLVYDEENDNHANNDHATDGYVAHNLADLDNTNNDWLDFNQMLNLGKWWVLLVIMVSICDI